MVTPSEPREARYVAVLTRAIPVDGCPTDTRTHVCADGETVADVMAWARRASECTLFVRLEIVKDEQP